MEQRRLWMMSNRQPWTEAVIKGIISTKTRNRIFMKPGDLVFLHATKSDWDGWQYLSWMKDRDIREFPHGGVYGIARVNRVGETRVTMPEQDKRFFVLKSVGGSGTSCAMDESVVFDDVYCLPFVSVPGRQNVVTKLPDELLTACRTHPAYIDVLRHFGWDMRD